MTSKQINSELIKFGKNFTILYVEDEESVRHQMKRFFEKIFKNVFIGVDGVDGLKLYNENSIDIVITDIDMPHMNGLEMSEQIRKDSHDIPIGIISAFEDSIRFSKAIDVGVTKYILKPINNQSLLIALHDMMQNLQYKIDAKKYHKKLQNEKISQAVEKTAKYFLQSIPSPVFVVDSNKKIVYLNELLNEMLNQKNIKVELGDSVELIESMFLLDNGENISVENIDVGSESNPKISFKNEKNSLFFAPLKEEVEIPTIDGISSIVVLNDITIQIKQISIIEYQKEKMKANREVLESFLSKNIFAVSDEQQEIVDKVTEQNEFNENESLLRRTHIYKISADDYMSTLSDTIADDLEELNEIQLDLQSELYEFEYSQKYETLETIAGMFQLYTRPLIRLIEFSDLADAVESVAEYLHQLTQEHVDSNGFMIKVVIQSILDDLSNWNEIVFVTQATNDIHYLDSSLYNTIIELKNSFIQPDATDEVDADELEFF